MILLSVFEFNANQNGIETGCNDIRDHSLYKNKANSSLKTRDTVIFKSKGNEEIKKREKEVYATMQKRIKRVILD